MGNKSHFFRQSSGGDYNTIIGGVGASINTDVLLAELLQIDINTIEDFAVVDNNVYCNITSEYDIPSSCFALNQNITSFIDTEGKVITLFAYCFQQCANLETVYFPEVKNTQGSTFSSSKALKEIYLPKLQKVSWSDFSVCESIEVLNLPSALTSENASFRTMRNLREAYLPKMTTISERDAFTDSTYAVSYYLPLLECGDAHTIFNNNSSLKELSLPATKQFNTDNLYLCFGLEVLNLPSLENFGLVSPASNDTLYGFPPNITINLPIALETTPNTVVREWIDLMVSLKNATINYV